MGFVTELASDLDVALAAAAAGASAVRAAYGAALIKHGKSGTDFATDADIDAERAILDVITGARPRDAVDGEELGRGGNARSSRRWLVDPLCGRCPHAPGSIERHTDQRFANAGRRLRGPDRGRGLLD